jgi:leucyl-tRNA synthetase
MFMGPLEATKPWNMRGVEGVYRFLGRVWRLLIDDRAEDMRLSEAVKDTPPERDTLRELHRTIQRVTEDLDDMRFNTAIAAMMEFTNYLTPLTVRPRAVLEPFVLLLAPFAPHLAEELWHALGHPETLAYEPWPAFDPALTKADEIEVPVQINGKVRLRLTVPAEIDKAELEKMALADARVRQLIEGKQVRKVIVVPGKLVNIVVG